MQSLCSPIENVPQLHHLLSVPIRSPSTVRCFTQVLKATLKTKEAHEPSRSNKPCKIQLERLSINLEKKVFRSYRWTIKVLYKISWRVYRLYAQSKFPFGSWMNLESTEKLWTQLATLNIYVSVWACNKLLKLCQKSSKKPSSLTLVH